MFLKKKNPFVNMALNSVLGAFLGLFAGLGLGCIIYLMMYLLVPEAIAAEEGFLAIPIFLGMGCGTMIGGVFGAIVGLKK